MSSRARLLPYRCRPGRSARRRALAIVLAGITLAGVARADVVTAIFQIDDTPGEIHLSDRPEAMPGTAVLQLAGSAPGRPPASPTPAGLSEIVRSAAAAQRLPAALIDAIIDVESAHRVRAVSSRGASGLMQLMPATARLYGVTDIFDPRQNIGAGSRHLRSLLDRYDQDVARALAAYNAGPGAVDRAATLRQPWPNAETAAYVPNVMRRYAALALTGAPHASVASAH